MEDLQNALSMLNSKLAPSDRAISTVNLVARSWLFATPQHFDQLPGDLVVVSIA